jgi:hypothetical protein
MFVEQRQHTWRSRESPLVLITATNIGETPLFLFRIGNSYFTHTFEKNGQQETETLMSQRQNKTSASNVRIILCFGFRNDELGVLELLSAKKECVTGFAD